MRGGDFNETDTTLSVDLVTNDRSLSSIATLDSDIDTNQTSITVTSMVHSDVNVNDYVQIDDEVVKVTDIADDILTIDRHQLDTSAADHSKGAGIFPLALNVSQGDYLQIESEILRVKAVYGNDLEVSRGQLSTVAEVHSNGSTVTHAACLLNGSLNAVAQSLTLTSTAALGVVRGDKLKIDGEVLKVESVTGNRLSVTRGVNDNTGTTTEADAHTNGAIVQLHQKGAPNSKAHLEEAVLEGTKTTLTEEMTDASITVRFNLKTSLKNVMIMRQISPIVWQPLGKNLPTYC